MLSRKRLCLPFAAFVLVLSGDINAATAPAVATSPIVAVGIDSAPSFEVSKSIPATTTVPERAAPATASRSENVGHNMRPLVTLGSGSIVDVAIDQLGKPYRYGATGPNAFDCSGLVYYVLNRAGIHVPRLTSDGYYRLFAKTTRAALVPGDLAVYPDHIAIYVGGGNIIAATTPRGGVKRQSIDAPGRPFGFVHPA